MHQHRRLGVPVRLRADVDAGDDDVDLAAVLGEAHDPPQRRRDPVHVLGAGVHRDLRAGRQREPLDRHAELLGEVERGDHAPALGLGERAERARRVAEHDHAQHALRDGARCGCARGRRRCSRCSSPAGARRARGPPSASRSCSTNSPGGIVAPGSARSGASSLTISAGWTVPRRRAETIRAAPSSSTRSGSVGGSSISITTPRPAGLRKRSTRLRAVPRMRTRIWTSSSPSSPLSRA